MEERRADEDLVDRHSQTAFERWSFLDPDVEGAVSRIMKLQRYLDRSLGETLSKNGLSHGEYKTLIQLAMADPPHRLSPGELSQHQMLSSGAMTNRLDRLEKSGFVRRLPDPNDRRGVLVELTDAGAEVLETAIQVQAKREIELLDVLSAREKKDLNVLLRKLMISFETSLGPPPKATGQADGQS